MSAREAAANLLMVAGTAAIAYAIVYTILNQQPKATAAAFLSGCRDSVSLPGDLKNASSQVLLHHALRCSQTHASNLPMRSPAS
mgnify:CR=1 FL=1